MSVIGFPRDGDGVGDGARLAGGTMARARDDAIFLRTHAATLTNESAVLTYAAKVTHLMPSTATRALVLASANPAAVAVALAASSWAWVNPVVVNFGSP